MMLMTIIDRVKDVAATFKRSKADHGKKTTSTQNYAETLKKKFVSIMGAPAWASLEKNDQPKDDDSDDEFFRVSHHTNEFDIFDIYLYVQ